MRATRWMLVLGALVTAVTAVVVSCVIDDDPTWLRDPECRGTCNPGGATDYSCDVDSSCTPAPGCVDWDCSETSPDDGADTPDVGTPPPDATEGDSFDTPDAAPGGDADDDATDVPAVAEPCRTSGGGPTREAADLLTLGIEEANLIACPTTSQWFAFDAVAGLRFVIDLRPGVGELVFLLYAGDDPAPIGSATMIGPGTYRATAVTAGRYYLRIRAVGESPVSYSLAVGPEPAR